MSYGLIFRNNTEISMHSWHSLKNKAKGCNISCSIGAKNTTGKKMPTRKSRYSYNPQGHNSPVATGTLVGEVTPCVEANLRPLSQKLFKNRFSTAAFTQD